MDIRKSEIFGTPAGRVFRFLLERGSATVKEIEDGLKVTRNAVKTQIDLLVAQSLIGSRMEKNERGRPYQVYFVTDKGRESLPDQYKDLFHTLWTELAKNGDPEFKRKVLELIGSRLVEMYEDELKGVPEEKRIPRFKELLNQKGIPAEFTEEGNKLVLHEYNCPYYSLAKEDSDVCKMEVEMLEKIIKSPIEREESLLKGAHACKFKMNQKETVELSKDSKEDK
jgi:predicted ArsR family transcriptional regulator